MRLILKARVFIVIVFAKAAVSLTKTCWKSLSLYHLWLDNSESFHDCFRNIVITITVNTSYWPDVSDMLHYLSPSETLLGKSSDPQHTHSSKSRLVKCRFPICYQSINRMSLSMPNLDKHCVKIFIFFDFHCLGGYIYRIRPILLYYSRNLRSGLCIHIFVCTRWCLRFANKSSLILALIGGLPV